jgi:hypothetical protein
MAIVGHFDNLAEAQKLVQSKLLAGVVQEIYEEGSLLSRLPVMTIDSKSVKYNREDTIPSADFYDIHEQIPWTADVKYATQKEVELKRVARQDILDAFIMDTYKDPNDYRTIVLGQLRKGVMRTVEDNFIYGDTGVDSKTPDGLHRLLDTDIAGGDAFTSATNLQAFDMGGASAPVSISRLRQLIDQVKPRPSILLMTRTMRNTLSATAFEKGIVLSNAQPLGGISYSADEFGRRVDFFDGIPIVITDYLLNEDDNTGGKDTGNDSGIVSIYAIKLGSIMDGGLTLTTGGMTGSVEMFKMRELPDLEDYDAGGIRLVAYYALALGSSKGMARIHSIDEDGDLTT